MLSHDRVPHRVELFLCHSARRHDKRLAVVIVSRDQVHVKMKYGLTRDLIVVLKYVKTVAAELFRHRHCHLSGKREHFCRDAVVDLVQIPVVIFWQDQCMPLCDRVQIQDHPEIVILIN